MMQENFYESQNDGKFRLHITGKHYMSGSVMLSDIYGSDLFVPLFAPEKNCDEQSEAFADGSQAQSDGIFYVFEQSIPEKRKNEKRTKTAKGGDTGNIVEYHTEGELTFFDGGEAVIEYGDNPVRIHIYPDNVITLESEASVIPSLVFVENERCAVSSKPGIMLSTVFTPGDNVQFFVRTYEITNTLTENGGSLTVDFSLELGYIGSERTRFTLTARPSV